MIGQDLKCRPKRGSYAYGQVEIVAPSGRTPFTQGKVVLNALEVRKSMNSGDYPGEGAFARI